MRRRAASEPGRRENLGRCLTQDASEFKGQASPTAEGRQAQPTRRKQETPFTKIVRALGLVDGPWTSTRILFVTTPPSTLLPDFEWSRMSPTVSLKAHSFAVKESSEDRRLVALGLKSIFGTVLAH